MSMLTQGVERSSGKQFVLRALAALTLAGVLAALIALKTAIYVWHLHA